MGYLDRYEEILVDGGAKLAKGAGRLADRTWNAHRRLNKSSVIGADGSRCSGQPAGEPDARAKFLVTSACDFLRMCPDAGGRGTLSAYTLYSVFTARRAHRKPFVVGHHFQSGD